MSDTGRIEIRARNCSKLMVLGRGWTRCSRWRIKWAINNLNQWGLPSLTLQKAFHLKLSSQLGSAFERKENK